MSIHSSDIRMCRVVLWVCAVIGVVLTIISTGELKLVFFKFQVYCLISWMLLLLTPEKYINKYL